MTYRLAATFAASALLLAACSGKGDDDGSAADGPAFDPARAEELAHAMMLAPADLPGSGWEVTSRDDFDSGDEDFDAVAAGLKECQFLTDLSKLGGPFDDDSDAAGRAQVELERPGADDAIPTSVELEVEVEATVVEVQGGWKTAKSLLESKEMRECFPALMRAAMLEEDLEGLKISIDAADPSADPPHDGAALAFAMEIGITATIKFEAAFEMYLWPYSNAGVSVFIGSSRGALSRDDIEAILETIDKGVKAAAKD